MKAIIDGKRYDTETATEIVTYNNGFGYGDFKLEEETLYQTKKGAWFIDGQGGPLSSYSVPVGSNGRGGSRRITPCSADEAREWLERYQFADELEEHFPDSIEDA